MKSAQYSVIFGVFPILVACDERNSDTLNPHLATLPPTPWAEVAVKKSASLSLSSSAPVAVAVAPTVEDYGVVARDAISADNINEKLDSLCQEIEK